MDQNQQQFQEQYYQQPPVVKNAAYFRARAREALKNKFWIAVLAVFLATLLGATMLSSSGVFNVNLKVNINLDEESVKELTDSFTVNGGLVSSDEAIQNLGNISPLIAFGIAYAMLFSFLFAALSFLLGSVITIGYQKFNLDLIDGKPALIKTVFSYFPLFGKALGLKFMYLLIMVLSSVPMLIGGAVTVAISGGFTQLAQTLLNLLRSIMTENSADAFGSFYLLTLPLAIGMVASAVLSVILQYRYIFSFTILAEYPQIGVMDALRSSASLTKGHKWKLFCLQMSFIGWFILMGVITVFTFGLGALLIYPLMAYQNAACTAFYDEIANRSAAKETEFPSINPDDYNPDQTPSDTSAYAYGGASYAVKEWKFPDDKEIKAEEKTEEKTSDVQNETLEGTSDGEETDQ